MFAEGDASRTHRLGVSSLLTKPEFSRSQALLPVMQVLEDDTVLLQILDDAASGPRAPACASDANDAAALAGVSVVANRYGRGASAGVVAGGSHARFMDYSKVIQACASRARRWRTCKRHGDGASCAVYEER